MNLIKVPNKRFRFKSQTDIDVISIPSKEATFLFMIKNFLNMIKNKYHAGFKGSF